MKLQVNEVKVLLKFGKKQDVIDYCKLLIDTCAPGGYIFDTNSLQENARLETLKRCLRCLKRINNVLSFT